MLLQILTALLMPLAVWRLWRLFAIDPGPKCILRKFRKRIGVVYSADWSQWHSNDGSFADGLTCIYCSPLWYATALVILFIFVPVAYMVVAGILNAAALATVFETKLYKGGR